MKIQVSVWSRFRQEEDRLDKGQWAGHYKDVGELYERNGEVLQVAGHFWDYSLQEHKHSRDLETNIYSKGKTRVADNSVAVESRG